MGSFDARLLGPAIRFLEAASKQERQELGRIIDRVLCYDPYIDNMSKWHFPVPPAIIALYRDDKYWVAYQIVRNTRLLIWNIGQASDKPVPFDHEGD